MEECSIALNTRPYVLSDGYAGVDHLAKETKPVVSSSIPQQGQAQGGESKTGRGGGFGSGTRSNGSFGSGGRNGTFTGGTATGNSIDPPSSYDAEKEKLKSEADKEFSHNVTDWNQTNIRNFAVNSDFPQAAGIVNYIQLLQQSPKGIEYERYTAAEQESEKEQKLTEMKEWANENGRDPVLSAVYGKDTSGVLNLPSGISLITAPFQGADYILDALETACVGSPLPSSTPNFTETTQTLREGVSQDMTETGKFFYNTAMSTADSLIAGKLGGSTGGGIILGLGAASNTASDIKNRGGSDEDALIGGAVSGILEGVFEKVSLSQLEAMKYLPADTVKNVLGNIAKSVVTNAGKEFSTELANIAFDTIFMGELSTYALSVKGYLAQGKTEADAKWLAGKDLMSRLGESAASGALTGVMFGTGASTEAYYRSQLAAQGEAKLLAGKMPTKAELHVLNLSESEARGMMAVFEMQRQDAATEAGKSASETSEQYAADARDAYEKITKRSTTKIQNGFACFPDGDPLNENVKMVVPLENHFDVAMHGTPTAVGFGTSETNMSPRFLANYILHSEEYNGQNIRLLSCSTGKITDGEYCFAEELANILGVDVYAPNDTLYIFPSGRFSIGDDGSGSFVLFKPNQRGRIR